MPACRQRGQWGSTCGAGPVARLPVLTLVIQLLQLRQRADHRRAVLFPLAHATLRHRVVRQPEDAQGRQAAEVRHFADFGQGVAPQVHLAQPRAAGHVRQRADAVDAAVPRAGTGERPKGAKAPLAPSRARLPPGHTSG